MHKRNYHNAIQPYRSPIHHVPPPTPTPRTRSSILKNIPHLPIYLNHPLPPPPLPLPSSSPPLVKRSKKCIREMVIG